MYSTGGGNGGNGGGDGGSGGGGGGFGGGNGAAASNDNYGVNGSPGGTAPAILIDDPAQTIYNWVKGQVETFAALPGGSGDDILDGGPGSDDLFGMEGTNTFVFNSCDAQFGKDVDTIYMWNIASANKIELNTDGVILNTAEVSAIIAAQTPSNSFIDRTIVHADGANQVTIVIKDIGRDLLVSDFNTGPGGEVCPKKFPWHMFLPGIISPKK
jgi:hypothetical protein